MEQSTPKRTFQETVNSKKGHFKKRRHIANGDLAVVIFMANKTEEESHWWTNLALVWHHVMGIFLYSHGIKSKRNVFGCDILTVP